MRVGDEPLEVRAERLLLAVSDAEPERSLARRGNRRRQAVESEQTSDAEEAAGDAGDRSPFQKIDRRAPDGGRDRTRAPRHVAPSLRCRPRDLIGRPLRALDLLRLKIRDGVLSDQPLEGFPSFLDLRVDLLPRRRSTLHQRVPLLINALKILEGGVVDVDLDDAFDGHLQVPRFFISTAARLNTVPVRNRCRYSWAEKNSAPGTWAMYSGKPSLAAQSNAELTTVSSATSAGQARSPTASSPATDRRLPPLPSWSPPA